MIRIDPVVLSKQDEPQDSIAQPTDDKPDPAKSRVIPKIFLLETGDFVVVAPYGCASSVTCSLRKG
ncbi:hypothetical protein SCHPADRAFT_906757 [Schizopora paradoxa]|uniref:Uncharacterized protein n=1 Tax=Schizopora paradoxa TaxID=27342 RepID=A0A0H2RFM0_9AGAM|nr:hypothetical protein SCHPADRAFT_906757 [Schizopora paradoxa]